MAIEIDFTYVINGSFDSVNYYRSETSMDSESMPAATATGITDLTYTDTTATAGDKYYVRFGTKRGALEKISSEITVYTGDRYFANVVALLGFDSAITDATGKSWSLDVGTAAYSDSPISAFNKEANFATWNIKSANDTNLVFSADFTIEFFVTITNLVNYYNTVISTANSTWASPISFIMVYGSNAPSPDVANRRKVALGVYGAAPLITSNTLLNQGQRYHVAFQRSGNQLSVWVDGVLENTVITTQTFYFSNTSGTSIGCSPWDRSTGYLNGKLDELRITKGVARYSSNFTPPSKPFYRY